MHNINSSLLCPALTLAVAAATFFVCAPTGHAKNGKDDPVGHNAGDDKGGTNRSGSKGRGGADDLAGRDIAPPRPSGEDPADHDADELGRAKGADDPVGHDAGDDKGGANNSGGNGGGGKDGKPGHG